MSNSKHGRHEMGLLLNTLFVFVFTMLMCTQQIIRGVAVFTNNDKLSSMAKVHNEYNSNNNEHNCLKR
ncbi:hypothetical protein GCK32_019939 [Trichostrongylus colubriformis]|uniref:Transmembrane protein n=1 Tax=Trichostrongylus colubriformis TaxID=6319 RepID=A0AAN8IZ01_TRICO